MCSKCWLQATSKHQLIISASNYTRKTEGEVLVLS